MIIETNQRLFCMNLIECNYSTIQLHFYPLCHIKFNHLNNAYMFASNIKTTIMKTVHIKRNTRANQNTIGYKWSNKRRFN